MKPSTFDHHPAGTIEEAVGLLAELGDEAKVIAGGQSLVPMLAMRLAVFSHLVDIGPVKELRGLRSEDGRLTVLAATPDVVLERDADVASAVPLLAKVTPLIGHFQIRNRGTVGGSLAHADPAAEYPAVAIALEAELDLVSTRGTRRVTAADFFEGVWTTALAPDELLAAAHFPMWDGRCGFAVEEFARRHGDFALVGSVAGVELDTDDRITRATVALFGIGPVPVRARSAERALVGSEIEGLDLDEVGSLAMSDVEEAPSDLHGSGAYRLRVGAAMVSRAVRRAVEEAADG